MSDIQDPLLIALQRRMQQRQILALMGINQWVQPKSETMNIADIAAPVATDMTAQPTSSHMSAEQPSGEDLNRIAATSDVSNMGVSNNDISSIESMDLVSDTIGDEVDSAYDHDAYDSDIDLHRPNQPSPVSYHFDTSTSAAAPVLNSDIGLQQTTASTEQIHTTDNHYDHTLKVTPFDLQGGRYGDWVVFVDIQALNHDSQKLWHNITQALSITCETTSFPICEGMDTAELANASLAGYVFKIGRSEEIKVAALTALPDGLEHPNLTTMPTLDEMLADSSLKRQFWAQLSD